MNIAPRPRQSYTFSEIVNQLSLLDSPNLMFRPEGRGLQNVQDSHIDPQELLRTGKWADSYWEYQYTTNEWIPIFYFNQARSGFPISDLVDAEQVWDDIKSEYETLYVWVTPKGFPRDQYGIENAPTPPQVITL